MHQAPCPQTLNIDQHLARRRRHQQVQGVQHYIQKLDCSSNGVGEGATCRKQVVSTLQLLTLSQCSGHQPRLQNNKQPAAGAANRDRLWEGSNTQQKYSRIGGWQAIAALSGACMLSPPHPGYSHGHRSTARPPQAPPTTTQLRVCCKGGDLGSCPINCACNGLLPCMHKCHVGHTAPPSLLMLPLNPCCELDWSGVVFMHLNGMDVL